MGYDALLIGAPCNAEESILRDRSSVDGCTIGIDVKNSQGRFSFLDRRVHQRGQPTSIGIQGDRRRKCIAFISRANGGWNHDASQNLPGFYVKDANV